jgi:hypothetical protein
MKRRPQDRWRAEDFLLAAREWVVQLPAEEFAQRYLKGTGYSVEERVPLEDALQLFTGTDRPARARERIVRYLRDVGIPAFNPQRALGLRGKRRLSWVYFPETGKEVGIIHGPIIGKVRIPKRLSTNKEMAAFIEGLDPLYLKPRRFSPTEIKKFFRLYETGFTSRGLLWWGAIFALVKAGIRKAVNQERAKKPRPRKKLQK